MADDTTSTYEAEVAEVAQNGPALHLGCPGLPDCRWLAGLLPHNGPFVTDHAGWHEAGSHATAYGDDGPSCTCGADIYGGDNDGTFPHLADTEMVIVCAATGQRIGYVGETVDPNPEANNPSQVMIPGLSAEDVSRLAYACDVLAAHAAGDDYRTWATTTAERFRSLLWDLANNSPKVVTGTDPGVIACASVYHAWPAEDQHRFKHCGTCRLDVRHTVKIQNFGWQGTLAICTAPSCDWSEVHEGGNNRGRAIRRAEHHVGIGPAVDDWGDPLNDVLDCEAQEERDAVSVAGIGVTVDRKEHRHD